MYEKLVRIGFSQFQIQHACENEIEPGQIARVLSSSHEVFKLLGMQGELFARLTGKLRFGADSAHDMPTTGDWVEISLCAQGEAVINELFPRQTYLARSAVGKRDEQILAANINSAIVVMAAGRDFKIARTDRYLSLILDQEILPIVFVNKIDLVSEEEVMEIESSLYRRHPAITVVTGSILQEKGLKTLVESLSPGLSFCVVGSSGVGKSSLINYLAGKQLERVSNIGSGTDRGRHTTSSGHLSILENGAILIDTPGLREVGLTNAESGIQQTFFEMEELASQCRFFDCSHQSEPGCAIQSALEAGKIQPEKLESFFKLRREAARFGQTMADKRKKGKAFGKMAREVLKIKKQLKG